MLGFDKPLEWIIGNDGVSVIFPTILQDMKNRPCEYAWILKIRLTNI
jgi:hypothetical protein